MAISCISVLTYEQESMKDLGKIRQLVSEDLAAVDTVLIEHLKMNHPLVDQLSQHIVNGGGKRLRPLIAILGTKAFDYQEADHIQLAAAMELFHNATLLHDDVVDQSQLRHGLKTANEIWGNKPSILVGDFLFTRSFEIMVTTANIKVLQVLASASNHITQGEILQLLNRHQANISEQQYMEIIKKKTATLFAAAAQLGAILADRSSEEITAMANFGLHLGMAFQIVDDTLDYCAETARLGKNIGDDLADGKITLPLIKALETAPINQQILIKEAIQTGNLNELGLIIETIKTAKAVDYAHQIAQQQIDQALMALTAVPPSIYRDALAELTQFAIERQH